MQVLPSHQHQAQDIASAQSCVSHTCERVWSEVMAAFLVLVLTSSISGDCYVHAQMGRLMQQQGIADWWKPGLCCCGGFSQAAMLQPRGRAITIRKYGFLLPFVEEEERLCSGQPSARGALIFHLDVIYCGLHRENSVYCNRDHNYHQLALSQDQTCVVCACVCTRTRLCADKDICTCINGLMLRKWCLSKPTFKQT